MNHLFYQQQYARERVFIGGIADGRRITIPAGEYPYYQVAEAFKPPVTPHEIFGFEIGYKQETDIYRRQEIRCDGEQFEFYVWDKYSPSDAIMALIKKYKQP